MTSFEEKYLNKRVLVYSEQLQLTIHATVIKVVNDEDDEENAFIYINDINLIDGEPEDLALLKNLEGTYSINIFEIKSVFEPK